MATEKNVAMYARTACEYRGSLHNVHEQIEDLRRYCAEQGRVVVTAYSDAGVAGDGEQPALRQMIEAASAESKPFDAVVVQNLDRFSRDKRTAFLIDAKLFDLGIDVVLVSVNDMFPAELQRDPLWQELRRLRAQLVRGA